MEIPNGIHERRLSENCTNPREVAWNEAWKAEHQYHDTLSQLFVVPCEKGAPDSWESFGFLGGIFHRPLGVVTERDRIVAATVLQWLGSNVGMCLVADALKRAGMRIHRDGEARPFY